MSSSQRADESINAGQAGESGRLIGGSGEGTFNEVAEAKKLSIVKNQVASKSQYGVKHEFNEEIIKINDLYRPFKAIDQKLSRTERLIQIYEQQMHEQFAPKRMQSMHGDTVNLGGEDNPPNAAGDEVIISPTKKKKSAKKMKKDPVLTEFKNYRMAALQKELNIDINKQKDDKKAKKDKMKALDDEHESVIGIFRENSEWRKWWDGFVLAVAIFNAVSIPVAIAFQPMWSQRQPYVAIDLCTNGIFIIDILIVFNTAYYDKEGEEITNHGLIAKKYLSGMFMIDLLSSIPFTYLIPSVPQMRLFGMLKVVRIRRITKIVNKLQVEEEVKAQIKIFKLLVMLFFIMNIIACTWFLIISVDQMWVPPLDFFYGGSRQTLRFYDQHEVGVGYQYMVCLYTAVLALGGNEMGPRTNVEILSIFIILIILAIYNATIFGEMTVLVQMCTRKSTDFQEQIDVANTAMKNIDLPDDAQQKVRNYLITTQGTHYEQKELQSFIRMISPSLNVKVAICIFTKIVKKNNRLARFIQKESNKRFEIMKQVNLSIVNEKKQIVQQLEENYIDTIVRRMKTYLAEPDQVIIENLLGGEAMYLIAKGECKVFIGEDQQNTMMQTDEQQKDSKDKQNQNIKQLRPGQYFGEISLVYGCECTAQVIASKYCTLARLDIAAFNEIITQIPSIQDEIKLGIYEYDDRMLRFIKRSMESVPYFAALKNECLYDIIFALKTTKYQKDHILQKPGDDATKLFFLQNGTIEVYTEFEGKEFVIERLFRGSIINYRTFFMEEHGQVYLRFSTQSIMKELSYEKMEQVCANHPDLAKTFTRYKLAIIKESKGMPLDYVMVLPKRITKKILEQTQQNLVEQDADRLLQLVSEENKQRRLNDQKPMTPEEEFDFKMKQIPNEQVLSHMTKAFKLENTLKNVVIRRLAQIRELKNKRNLKESVELIMKKNQEVEAKKRRKLKKKIDREYETRAAGETGEDKDALYNRVISNMHRLLKVLTSHSQAVDSLERKLTEISAKRNKNPDLILEGLPEPIPEARDLAEEDGMYSTMEIPQFNIANDDVNNMLEEEDKRDEYLDQLKKSVVDEPDPAVLASFRMPVDPMESLNLDSDRESMKNISSDESDPVDLSQDGDDGDK